MTKLTVEVPDEVARRVAAAAADRGVAPETLAAETLVEHFAPVRRLSFIGLGRSGHTDTAQRHDDLLDEAFGTATSDR